MSHYIEIRRNILKALYEAAQEAGSYQGLSTQALQQHGFNGMVPDPDVRLGLEYLEDKGYIKINWGVKYRVFAISLTPDAVDLLEDESEFNRQFPTSTVIIGNNNVVGHHNTIDFSTKIEQSSIDETSKEQILTFLSEIAQATASQKQSAFDKYIRPLGQGVLLELIKQLFIS